MFSVLKTLIKAYLLYFIMKSNILLVISCSKGKLENSAPAKNLYTGQLFKALAKLATQNQWDLRILSGKLGLIAPNDIIEPYNQKLQSNQEDIKRVQALTLPKLEILIPHYDKIIVFMSKNYRRVIEPLVNEKFVIIHHEKGIFGYNRLVFECNKLATKEAILELEKHDGYYKKQQDKESTLERFL